MPPTTYPLDGSEWAMLREQVATVQALVTRRFGAARFDDSVGDLPALQRVFDDNLFDESQEDELGAVATAFGNVVAKVLGFEWVAESDGRGGRQLALILKATKALVVQPRKMVLDRVRRGDSIDLVALLADIKAQVERTKILPKKLG